MSSDDYTARAERRNAQAAEEYRQWVAGLSPKERRDLAALNLAEPLQERYRVSGRGPHEDCDPADKAVGDLAGPAWEPAPATPSNLDDPLLAQTIDELGLTGADADLAARLLAWRQASVAEEAQRLASQQLNLIIGLLISAKNVRVCVAGLAFATGLPALNGVKSQAAWAKAHGLSTATVSKAAVQWRKLLNLPPSRHMKSLAACRAYSVVGKTRHWRKKPYRANPKLPPNKPIK